MPVLETAQAFLKQKAILIPHAGRHKRHCIMKKLLLISLMILTALTMTHCVNGDDGNGGVPNNHNSVDTVDPDEYVDLGLISMTMWKAANEVKATDSTDGFFTYDEAVATYGNRLPTMEQFYELMHSCEWVWLSIGCYKVFGPNKNYILLPADGFRDCMGAPFYARSYGFYWSSTPNGPEKAWYLNFYSDDIYMYNYSRCYANSVRLVKNVQDY